MGKYIQYTNGASFQKIGSIYVYMLCGMRKKDIASVPMLYSILNLERIKKEKNTFIITIRLIFHKLLQAKNAINSNNHPEEVIMIVGLTNFVHAIFMNYLGKGTFRKALLIHPCYMSMTRTAV